MRKAAILVCAFVLVADRPAPASACGFAAHRDIMGRAIDLLPSEMKPFFEPAGPIHSQLITSVVR
jgi:hypothetical protein